MLLFLWGWCVHMCLYKLKSSISSLKTTFCVKCFELPVDLLDVMFQKHYCVFVLGTKRLECVRSDGLGRRVVSSAPSHPFGLTTLNNVLYWTDWEKYE